MASLRIPSLALNAGTTVDVTSALYKKKVDEASDTVSYIGLSASGSSDSAPVWQIQRVTFTGPDIVIEWANNGQFISIWNNRASLTYN